MFDTISWILHIVVALATLYRLWHPLPLEKKSLIGDYFCWSNFFAMVLCFALLFIVVFSMCVRSLTYLYQN